MHNIERIVPLEIIRSNSSWVKQSYTNLAIYWRLGLNLPVYLFLIVHQAIDLTVIRNCKSRLGFLVKIMHKIWSREIDRSRERRIWNEPYLLCIFMSRGPIRCRIVYMVRPYSAAGHISVPNTALSTLWRFSHYHQPFDQIYCSAETQQTISDNPSEFLLLARNHINQ